MVSLGLDRLGASRANYSGFPKSPFKRSKKYEQERDLLIDHQKITSHMGNVQTVVDVGSGGDQLRSLHPKVTHIIDIFETKPDIAKQAEAAGIKFIVGDAGYPEAWAALPPVDYTICSHTLEDVFDPIPILRNINAHSRKGYIEFPSIAQEVLPLNSLYGSAHHSWFVAVLPKDNILGKSWTSATRDKSAIANDTKITAVLAFLPKILVYGDPIRGHRFIVPHARRFVRRKFWRRPYVIADVTKSWTGIMWSGRIEGVIINCDGFDDYRMTLQAWVTATAADPYVFYV